MTYTRFSPEHCIIIPQHTHLSAFTKPWCITENNLTQKIGSVLWFVCGWVCKWFQHICSMMLCVLPTKPDTFPGNMTQKGSKCLDTFPQNSYTHTYTHRKSKPNATDINLSLSPPSLFLPHTHKHIHKNRECYPTCANNRENTFLWKRMDFFCQPGGFNTSEWYGIHIDVRKWQEMISWQLYEPQRFESVTRNMLKLWGNLTQRMF